MSEIQELRTIYFDSIKCCSCGVEFMMERYHRQQRKDDGGEFFCPNGHSQYFCDSLKTRLEKAELEASRLRSQVQLERDQKAATEQSLLRLKKRVARGVCPCCKRTVNQLAKHMESKHPDYPQPK